jgi:hypothetical protein
MFILSYLEQCLKIMFNAVHGLLMFLSFCFPVSGRSIMATSYLSSIYYDNVNIILKNSEFC